MVEIGGNELKSKHPEWHRSKTENQSETLEAFDFTLDLWQIMLPTTRKKLFWSIDRAGIKRSEKIND